MKNFKHRMFITNDDYMSERPTEIMLTSEALNDLECGGKPSRLIPFKDFIVVENEELSNGHGVDPVDNVEDLRSPCCQDYLNEIDCNIKRRNASTLNRSDLMPNDLYPQYVEDTDYIVTYECENCEKVFTVNETVITKRVIHVETLKEFKP